MTDPYESNPFDTPDSSFLVLVNEDEQYSLWPADFPVPSGWTTALLAGTRDDALRWVEENWTDLRPRSVRATGAKDAG